MAEGKQLIIPAIKPKHRLGQHFLSNLETQKKIVEYANLMQSDTVLEVGPGLGALTLLIAMKAGKVIAVEKDYELVAFLKKKFADNDRVSVIEGDVLKIDLPPFNKVVSTPPYNISSKLLFLLLKKEFDLAVTTFQKEFAERLVAKVGSNTYGRLSVAIRHRAKIEILDFIPRQSFRPPPRVDSLVVRISLKEPARHLLNENLFNDLVRGLFNQRRRKLRSAFLHYLEKTQIADPKSVLPRITLPEKRVYQTTVEEFEDLSNQLHLQLQSSRNSRGL